jgi:hypothetical protein
MHGYVRAAIEHSRLDLLGEYPTACQFGDWSSAIKIALCFDNDDLDTQIRYRAAK